MQYTLWEKSTAMLFAVCNCKTQQSTLTIKSTSGAVHSYEMNRHNMSFPIPPFTVFNPAPPLSSLASYPANLSAEHCKLPPPPTYPGEAQPPVLFLKPVRLY